MSAEPLSARALPPTIWPLEDQTAVELLRLSGIEGQAAQGGLLCSRGMGELPMGSC